MVKDHKPIFSKRNDFWTGHDVFEALRGSCVHVFGDGEAKIDLLGPGLVWADGMTRGEVRRAVRLVAEQRASLLARWEEIHGRVD